MLMFLAVLVGEVVLEFSVDEAVATADALEQAAFGGVVEEADEAPGDAAVSGEDEAEAEVLDKCDTSSGYKCPENSSKNAGNK